jgi:hypothetical protein
VIDYRLDDQSSVPSWGKDIFLATVSIPTHGLIQQILGAVFLGKSYWSMTPPFSSEGALYPFHLCSFVSWCLDAEGTSPCFYLIAYTVVEKN